MYRKFFVDPVKDRSVLVSIVDLYYKDHLKRFLFIITDNIFLLEP